MNEPIISPLLFYGLSLLDGFVGLFLIVSIVSLVGVFVLTEDYEEDKYRNSKKAGIVSAIFFFLFIFTPSQRTAEKMLIAHYCTPAAVQEIGNKLEMSTVKLIEKIMNHRKEEKK